MIDIFEPLTYGITRPVPDEIGLIFNSPIEKYAVSQVSCADYLSTANGFLRFRKRHPSSRHMAYVAEKVVQISAIATALGAQAMLIRVDYFLHSGLTVGVYIRKDLNEMIGCIKGFRADMMTEEAFNMAWHDAPQRPHQ